MNNSATNDRFEGHWRQLLAKSSLALAAGSFSVVFLAFTIGLVLLALGGPIRDSVFIVACAGAAFVAVWVARLEGLHSTTILALLVVLVALIWATLNVATAFFDISWDGQAYHQEAIIQLAKGWNPFYQSLSDNVSHAIWIRHYPKAAWIFASSTYAYTGDLESGKAFQLLLGFAAFLLALSAALRIHQLPLWSAFMVSGVAMANPVAIYQSLSYYVDGAMASLLTAMVALSVILFLRPNWFLAMFLAAVGILAINLKFTGIPYVLIGGAGLAIIAAVARKFDVTRLAIWSVIGGVILGAVGFGYDPYVKNTISHGHPFFPLRGENAIDIMSITMPRPLMQMGRLEKLGFSLLHESTNDLNPTIRLKVPMSLTSMEEIYTFEGPDARLGAWGPLFGGIFILAIGAIGALIVLSKPRPRRTMLLMSATVVVLMASVVANPEAWWARYTPQFWLVPLIVSVALLSHRTKLARIAGLLVGLLMLVNSSLVAKAYYPFNYRTSGQLHAEMSRLARSVQPIAVNFGPFPALRVRLERANVPFTTVRLPERLSCTAPTYLHGTMDQTAYCY